MMKKLLVFLFCASIGFTYAQEEDAWIYLVDKENVAASIANPISILTQKAIDRKASQGIVIDERDVPVNESYITQLKNASGITVLAKSKWFNAVHVRGAQNAIEALEDLAIVSDIEWANKSLNGTRSAEGEVYTNKFEEDNRVVFDYGNTQNQVEMLNLHLLHQDDYTGQGITIAVMDSGFPNVNTLSGFQRLRDNGNLLDGYDFVSRDEDVYAFQSSSHGTRVMSCMAGFVQDEYVGTAPDASYYLFRTEDVFSETPVEESYWVEAAERADSLGVDIINTSLGYKGYDNPDHSHANEDLDGLTAFITRGSTIASEKGILLITSAGNSSTNGVGAPADAAAVFSIGAVDSEGNLSSFSSHGSAIQPTIKPDVVARGSASYVIDQTDTITQNNGTSFSSPITAGAMACLKQALPSLSNDQLKQLVRESASQASSPDFLLGYGIPDFDQAVDEGLSVVSNQITEFSLFPNPVDSDLFFVFPGGIDAADLLIFDVSGKNILEATVDRLDAKVDLSQLSSGIYFGSIRSDAQVLDFKILKK